MKKLGVAVIAGGPSAEAEVSRTSARGVVAALQKAGHSVTLLELNAEIAARLTGTRFDVVFPVTHGPLGEDGCLQGLLEVLDLPYVGSQVMASAVAASKPHAKVQLRARGLPVADDVTLTPGEVSEARVKEVRQRLGKRIVVKPASGGSAIGVEMIGADLSDEDVLAAFQRVFALEPAALVEPFVAGFEVTCGVLEAGEAEARALPPTWIRPQAAEHYDFVSKYRAGGSEHVCPAPFEPALTARIQACAVEAHRALGCRDLSRVDFVVNPEGQGSFIVLEVNTLPGMTATSLFPEAALVAGISFESLCDRLVQVAWARPRRVPQQGVAMP
ncbi:MAG: D-alanine--D-alanine ligase family protein [Myxococcota bacterium]